MEENIILDFDDTYEEENILGNGIALAFLIILILLSPILIMAYLVSWLVFGIKKVITILELKWHTPASILKSR